MSARKEYIKLVILLGVLLTILAVFSLYVSYPLLSTRTIILATQPVDPFDILRGQYITIRYEIGTIPYSEHVAVGDRVYVMLKEDSGGIARYKAYSLDRPARQELFIRGKVVRVNDKDIQVEYGIEQYFFERGGRLDTRGMTVKAKLSDEGGARIVELLVDGKPLRIEYQNKTLTS